MYHSPAPDLPQTHQDRFDSSWAAIALFGTLVSSLIALAYTFLRLGLATPAWLAPLGVATISAALFAPLLLPRAGVLARIGVRAAAYPLVTFGVLASVTLALWTGGALAYAYPVVALAGMARAIRVARASSARDWLMIAVVSAIAGTYLFVVVANLGYAGAYTPEQGYLGLLNHDTRFHATVTYLIQNFGVPSLGVDGMLPLHYHYGSHAWFAGFGRMAGTEPLYSYGAAVPIVAIPLLVSALLLSGLAIDLARKPARAYFALGLMLVFAADTIGWTSYYISETYTFALIGLLLFMPLAARLGSSGSGVAVSAGFALAVLAIPLLMSLKVSVGVLWAVGIGWLALRRYGMALGTFAAGAACAAALLAGLRLFAPGPGDYVHTTGAPFALFYILRAFPEIKAPFSSFVLPLALLLFAYAGSGGLRAAIARKADPLVEAVIVVTLAGAVPAYVGVPQDSAVWYFLNVGQWWAMPVLLARVSSEDFSVLRARIGPDRLARSLAVVLAFLAVNQLVDSLTPRFQSVYREILAAADQQSGGALLHGRNASGYLRETFTKDRTLFAADFRVALANSVGARLVAAVGPAGPPRPDQAVFVTPAFEAFWKFQADCRDKHNIQASMTGQPALLSGPPQIYGCKRDAYQTNYSGRIDSREIGDEELCAHARERGIRRVVIVDGSPGREGRLLECR